MPCQASRRVHLLLQVRLYLRLHHDQETLLAEAIQASTVPEDPGSPKTSVEAHSGDLVGRPTRQFPSLSILSQHSGSPVIISGLAFTESFRFAYGYRTPSTPTRCTIVDGWHSLYLVHGVFNLSNVRRLSLFDTTSSMRVALFPCSYHASAGLSSLFSFVCMVGSLGLVRCLLDLMSFVSSCNNHIVSETERKHRGLQCGRSQGWECTYNSEKSERKQLFTVMHV